MPVPVASKVDFLAAECNEVDEREAYVEKKDAGDTCC